MCIQDAASAANAMVAMTKSGGRYLCIYVYVNMPYHTAYSRSVVYVHSDDEESLSKYLPRRSHNICYWLTAHALSCYGVLQRVSLCCSYLLQVHAVSDAHMSQITGYLSATFMISQARMFLKNYYHALAAICTFPRFHACMCV